MDPFELTTAPDTLDSCLAVPGDLVEATRAYAAEAKAEGTRRAYRSGWRSFETWCETHGLTSLPATSETVALFLADRADQGMTVSTIEKQLAAISAAHRTAGFESPRGSAGVRAVLQGIRRSIGVAQVGKAPIGVVELRSAIEALPEGPLGKRDRALLTLGFAGAFRRSELVGLDVADISFVPEGMEVLIRHSKTDQEGRGRRVGIPFGGSAAICPVRAVQDWLAVGKIEGGPLLRSVDRHGRVGTARLGSRAVAPIASGRVPSHAARIDRSGTFVPAVGMALQSGRGWRPPTDRHPLNMGLFSAAVRQQ